jgi:hypothetical protein
VSVGAVGVAIGAGAVGAAPVSASGGTAAVVVPAGLVVSFTAIAVAVAAGADAGASEVSAVVVLDRLVEPAAVSAATTSADFKSRGSRAWNESVRNRPAPVLA